MVRCRAITITPFIIFRIRVLAVGDRPMDGEFIRRSDKPSFGKVQRGGQFCGKYFEAWDILLLSTTIVVVVAMLRVWGKLNKMLYCKVF